MNDNQDLKTKLFTLKPEDGKTWSRAMEYLTKHEDENLEVLVTHLGKVRTLTQNGCIHEYCSWLAQAFNEAAIYRERKLFGNHIQLPWTGNAVKEDIWHVVQYAVYPHAVNKAGEPSTTKLNTVEVGEVFKIISDNVAATKGINVPWPSRNSKG